MLATARNFFLFALVTGQDWPEKLGNYKLSQFFISWVADSAGLFVYPKCERWSQAREAWQEVVAVEGRPLSEMLRFPEGRIPGEEPSLYLRVCYGILGPMRLYCNREACKAYGSRVEQWFMLEAEINRLYLIYDLLDDLTRTDVALWKKRQKLAQLKDLLGDEDYERGKIPQIGW